MSAGLTHAYGTCQQKFARHPHAIRMFRSDGHVIHEMVIMLRDGDVVDFRVLERHSIGSARFYCLYPWPDGEAVMISRDEPVSPAAAEAVIQGVPLPQHGSLFGWSNGDSFTALIPAYTDPTATSSLPSWSVMPLADSPENQWPPFAGERYFGEWFWDDLQAGHLVSLATLVARTTDTVFWADTKSSLGSDTCVVAKDVTGADGLTLRRGAYVYAGVLRSHLSIPSLADLLADPTTVDIAEYFARPDEPGGNGGALGDVVGKFHD